MPKVQNFEEFDENEELIEYIPIHKPEEVKRSYDEIKKKRKSNNLHEKRKGKQCRRVNL